MYISLQRFYWRAIMCLCFYNISPSSPTWYFHPAQQVRRFWEKCKWDLNRLHRCYIIVSPSPPNGLKKQMDWQLGPWPQPSFFVICQVSRFVRPVGLQIFLDEDSFHSAGRENGPSVMRNGFTFLKHIKPAISFKYLFFILRF